MGLIAKFFSRRVNSVILFVPLVLSTSGCPVQALPTGHHAKVEAETLAVLNKCIELERYVLQYRSNVAKQGRWKSWRYFVSTESSAAIGLSGSILGTVERGQNFVTFKKLNRKVLENGNILGFLGQTIGASGAATEFGINAYHDLQSRRNGYSPQAGLDTVIKLKSEIDELLAVRTTTIEQLSVDDGYAAVAQAEGRLLLHFRNALLNEFVDSNNSARRLLGTQQSLYFVDVARNVLGATGNHFGYEALRTGNRHNNTTAGIFFTLSGVLTIANPITSRLVGRFIAWEQKRFMRPVSENALPTNTETFAQDLEAMRTLSAALPHSETELVTARAGAYAAKLETLQNQLNAYIKSMGIARMAAVENISAGSFVGATKVASGALFLKAGIDYRRSGRHTNELLGIANIVNTTGGAITLLDNTRLQVNRELEYQRRKKKGLLPTQVLQSRLQQLEDLQRLVRSADGETAK